jgi:P27 family predicted phage terminase small subunit
MARKAVPIALNKKNMSNTERKTREAAEARLRTGSDKVKPPSWLTREAKREFRRLAKMLLDVELVTNLDVDLLAMFANTLVCYREMDAEIREQGLMATYTNKAGAENTIPNPLLSHRKQLGDQLRMLAAEFGFTPSARAKLALPKPEEKEPTAFEQMFGNVVPLRRDAK